MDGKFACGKYNKKLKRAFDVLFSSLQKLAVKHRAVRVVDKGLRRTVIHP